VIQRRWPWRVAAAALAAAACVDVSSPKGGVVSISTLLLPSPGVVRGDVMRDSTGAPALLRIVAYDATNQPVSGLQAEFFVLDAGAHIDTNGRLVGDSLSTVRVVGAIGGLQTPPTSVVVTVAPVKIAATGTIDTLRVRVDADTTQNLSSGLGVIVTGAGDTAVAGVVVRYAVIRAPASRPGAPPTVYIADGSGRPMSSDTTDAGGRANRRRAAVRVNALNAVLDSIVVEASASYKGTSLQGSPVRLVIPARSAF
jgi:hypothetical protein